VCDFLPSLLPAVAASTAGYWLGARRPRRHVRTTATSTRRSLIPEGARPEPGDDRCVASGHRQLSWTEEIQRLRGGVTMRWLIDARCGECNQPQTCIRLVYPPDRILDINPPQPPDPGDVDLPDNATSPTPDDPPLDSTTQQPGANDPGASSVLTDTSQQGGRS
jgi:hypothetical protein